MTESRYGIGYSLPNDEDYALAKLGPALDEAELLGVDYVELPLYAIELVANGRVMSERLKRVKGLMQGRPFGCTVHGPLHLNLMDISDGEMQRAVLRAQLEIAAELGAPHYVAHAGRFMPSGNAETEAGYAHQREALIQAAELAQRDGVTIVVENIFGLNAGRESPLPSRLAAEIAAIGHPAIRACLDVSHAYLEAGRTGANFLDECAALAPFAKQLHIHDSFGKYRPLAPNQRAERLAYGIGDLHLPIGMGSIPWDALLERCAFPADAIFIHELAPPYWVDLAAAVEGTRQLAARAKIGTAR